ncbi:MAG: hypothetical protein H6738_24425 [Alphaproteobacteria bacterium]|nr:hypothetical protein [Alphaproteobacteria bacterium]MCB9699956.1 hypothetical protein [Alphaproteobacteria bacterium]
MRPWLFGVAFLAACAPEDDVRGYEAWDVTAEEEGWVMPPDANALPAPSPQIGATLQVVGPLMSGGVGTVGVTGAPPGATVVLLASLVGPGQGPCHPTFGALCADIRSPVVLGNTTASAAGVAGFQAHIPGALGGPVWLQAVVAGGGMFGTTAVVSDALTQLRADWVADDLLELSVIDGESGYDIGIAETFAGPVGWYGEDCLYGTYPWLLCHSVAGPNVRSLRSVHQNVGGPGINYVFADQTTLFYGGPAGMGGDGGPPGGDHPILTYAFFGHDSGDCWTFGEDTAYYENGAGCTPLF